MHARGACAAQWLRARASLYSARVRIGLVTCRELPRPDVELPLLERAFAALGAEARPVVWDDAGVDWSGFDAALIRSPWDYVAKFDAFTRWIDAASRSTRLLNDAATMRWNLHKRYLFDLAARGVDIIPTELVAAGQEPDWEALFARFGDIVLKPAISAGSFATIRVERGDRARASAHRGAHITRDFLVQPLLGSVVERGEVNIVLIDGRVSHAVEKGARWSGDREQSRGSVEPGEPARRLALAALDALPSLGLSLPVYARVDLAEGPDGRPLLMEFEAVEPALFLDRASSGAGALAAAVCARLR